MPPVKKPSVAQNPDLDWSQIRETLMMLNVALSQVERSMTEGDESINALTKSITALMGKVQVIFMASASLPETREKKTIVNNCQSAERMINDVVVAFQFYDRMAQRLSHVSLNLSSLGEIINNDHRLYSPYEWRALQEMIKSKYFIDSDRRMFDAIHNGAGVREAVQIGEHHRQKEKQQETVELF